MNPNYIQEINKRSLMTLKNHEQKMGAKNLILCAPSDLGTIHNFGRRGAQYASSAILSQLKKMAHHHQGPYTCLTVTNFLDEKNAPDFNQAQKNETNNILKGLQDPLIQNFFHLGGGHDHILPFLLAIQEKNPQKKLVIINIDAHLDTRIDSWSHSGNPFRLFSQAAKNPFHLIQVGIEKFANVTPNYTALNKGEMTIYSGDDVLNSENFIDLLKSRHQFNGDNILPILSLDADAICGSIMEGVSAVNPRGLSVEMVAKIFDFYFKLDAEKKYCGIYEYNPLFDNLSAKGAKALAGLIYPHL